MSRAISAFRKFSPVTQAAIVAVTAWNLTLTVAAERDLAHRSADEVRGGKVWWRLACLTNTVGPLIYFQWGRRRDG
jgi:hypothetical protein